MAKQLNENVFLNIPYDERFRPLYLAYIVGLVDLGLNPVVTLGLPGGNTRLSRILALIQSSSYSIHDLSRVELDKVDPKTPRFNMPFELGMAVAWATLTPSVHSFFVFESLNRRGHKSLSDLAGSDFNIHDGTPQGVMRELCSAFIRRREKPTVPAMMEHYGQLIKGLPNLLRQNGTKSVYEARMFADIVLTAQNVRRTSST